MSDFTRETSQLRTFLQRRGVSYNATKKTWRCPVHSDEHESAVLYENKDGHHMLHCPVCQANWDVFQLVELLDGCHDFKDKLKAVRDTLGIADEKQKRKKQEPVALGPEEVHKLCAPEPIKEIAQRKDWGEVKGSWRYTDAEGRVLALDVRFERGCEKKEVITFWYDGHGLRWAGAPVLIYNLHLLAQNPERRQIMIHEGAKKAELGNEKATPFLHLAWSGGSGKAQLADWSVLAGYKEVFMMPDDDDPGLRAAAKIKEKLPQLKVVKPLIEARKIKPKGADLFEILQVMTPTDFREYVINSQNHLSDSELAPGTPDAMTTPNCQGSPTNPRDPGALSQPFKILGIGDDGRAAFITAWGRMVKWNLDSMSKQKLKVLSSADYWNENFPMKGGADYDAAIDDIINIAQNKDFHESDIRGRGAWRDGDDISYHDGISPIGDYDKKKIYLRLPQHDIGISDEAAGMELTRAVKDTVFKMSFETLADTVRCLGWAVLAPFAGALPYRPAILMTGPSGSGKSTVAEIVVKNIGSCKWFNGNDCTSAYIRQIIKNDSCSAILDETEGKTDKQQKNRGELFLLMRASVSKNSPDSGRGGADGNPISFKMQNMFMFISIDPTIQDIADENRIFRVNMILPTNGDTWKEIETELKNLLSEKNCRAIRALTWQKLHVIFSLADRIVDIIREKTGRDYRSSYADALLASAFMVVWTATDCPTNEQIEQMLGKYYALQPAEEHRNEAAEVVGRIMDETIEILHDNNQREKMTIMQCLNRVYAGNTTADDTEEKIRDYRDHLARYGIRIADGSNVAVANCHHLISKIIDSGSGYNKILKRHPGYIDGQRSLGFFGVIKGRRCTVLKDIIKKKWDEKTEDEQVEALFE